jgi:hypothetical protein
MPKRRQTKRAPTKADPSLRSKLLAIRASCVTSEARAHVDLGIAVLDAAREVNPALARELRSFAKDARSIDRDLPGRAARLDDRERVLAGREAENAALARELRDLIVRERALAERGAKLRQLTPVARQIADDEDAAIEGLTEAFGLDDEGEDAKPKPRKRTPTK